MKLLLIFLSIITFTVESKSKVKATSDDPWPGSMSASYACTFKMGQVCAGDTATLIVTGLGGVYIEKIDLYLKSNKTGGAGKITMTADGAQIYSKEGTYKDWFGAYNNTDFQAIGWSGSQSVNALEIQVTGTTNSIHIEKYEITWSQGQAQPYTVTLMNGNEQYNVLTGSSVTLPSGLEPIDAWDFIGWSETEFWTTEQMPKIQTGSYAPSGDITLWAVYRKDVTPTIPLVTELTDGAYMYINTQHLMAMSGGVADGLAGASACDPYDPEQEYEITFDADGYATIKRMYIYSDEYIGFDGKQLANTPSKWNVFHSVDKTAFYTVIDNKNYMLFPGLVQNDQTYKTSLKEVNNIEQAPTALRTTDMPENLYLYTCHVEAEGLEEVTNEGMKELRNEWIIPFGNYELIIKNGRKELRLR